MVLCLPNKCWFLPSSLKPKKCSTNSLIWIKLILSLSQWIWMLLSLFRLENYNVETRWSNFFFLSHSLMAATPTGISSSVFSEREEVETEEIWMLTFFYWISLFKVSANLFIISVVVGFYPLFCCLWTPGLKYSAQIHTTFYFAGKNYFSRIVPLRMLWMLKTLASHRLRTTSAFLLANLTSCKMWPQNYRSL